MGHEELTWDPEEEVPDGPDNQQALDLNDISPAGYGVLNHRLEEQFPDCSDGIIESHNRWFYETIGGQYRHPEYD